MSKDGMIGFEAAIDFVSDRVEKMGLCQDCRKEVEKLLSALAVETRRRKVERIELEFPSLSS